MLATMKAYLLCVNNSVELKGNTHKWICRIRINSNGTTLIVPDEHKKEIIYPLIDIYEIKQHNDQLKDILKRYI